MVVIILLSRNKNMTLRHGFSLAACVWLRRAEPSRREIGWWGSAGTGERMKTSQSLPVSGEFYLFIFWIYNRDACGHDNPKPDIGSGCNEALRSHFGSAPKLLMKRPGPETVPIPRQKWVGVSVSARSCPVPGTDSQGTAPKRGACHTGPPIGSCFHPIA